MAHATRILPFGQAVIDEAAQLIRAGQLVAVGTETVYGLAADATNPEAVGRIYEAKGRPTFNPLIVHVQNLDAAQGIGLFDEAGVELAKQHWPGPLTIVVPLRQPTQIATAVTAGLPTIALRVPKSDAMQALLKRCGRPLAAPSANASGAISPTRAEHVLKSLNGRIPLIIDSGPTRQGLESTIVAATGGELRLLRRGPIEVGQARETRDAVIEAPGQLASHYAPSKPLRIGATMAVEGEFLIGFGAVAGDASLSPSGSLGEAAARLYDLLHVADESDVTAIAVAPIPEDGLGRAINDRLRRAATPR